MLKYEKPKVVDIFKFKFSGKGQIAPCCAHGSDPDHCNSGDLPLASVGTCAHGSVPSWDCCMGSAYAGDVQCDNGETPVLGCSVGKAF